MTDNPSLFPHQKAAFERLVKIARVFFRGRWHRIPVRPRFPCLIVGETGSGKTHLVRHLARRLSKPLLELSATNWLPLGISKRGGSPTWPEVIEFCIKNRSGIIFVDEIDKLSASGTSDWLIFIRTEMFSLIDQCLPTNVRPKSENDFDPVEEARLLRLARRRLSRSIFVIAAGAFQGLWQQRQNSVVGFHRTETLEKIEHRQLATIIPPEIVNRFASPSLLLEPLGEQDYKAMLTWVLCKIPFELRPTVQRRGEAELRNAVTNRLGCRWIEELLLHALVEHEIGPHTGFEAEHQKIL